MMIFDDIDGELDTIETTDKKEIVITKEASSSRLKRLCYFIRAEPCISNWHFRPFV